MTLLVFLVLFVAFISYRMGLSDGRLEQMEEESFRRLDKSIAKLRRGFK